jgi:glycine cleavage system H lipoate-binding protein
VATFPGWAILLIAIFIVGGVVTGGAIRYRKTLMTPAPVSGVETQAVFDESSVKAPAGLFFDRTHTWAFMEKDGLVRIGIDDFLQHITGTITRVEMKKPGDFIRKGEAFLSIIQEGKQLHIYAPVSGIIRENNRSLVNHSSLINSDPYAAGWIYMIEPANWIKETQLLSMAVKYRSWLSNEFTRVKDFLTASLQPNRPDKLVYQDGGTLKDNILAEFGPETWEEFQTRFLDTSK